MTDRHLMYEHRSHPLLPWPRFIQRAGRHLLWGTIIVSIAVGLGTAGYRELGGLPWIDSFLNASMIFSGMGPVDRIESTTGKLFAAFYALLCGLVFIAVAGVVMAPWVHRLVHRIHLDTR
jgi:hypothetical protein